MEINSVSNVQFRGLGNFGKKSNATTEVKGETTKTDGLEKDLDKMGVLGRSMVKKVETLPSQLDFTDRNLAAKGLIKNSKKILSQFALAMRYGNRPDAKLDENVLDNLKNYFESNGQEFNEKDIKVLYAGDWDGDRKAYKLPLYYDEATGLTTVFTKDGNPNYKVSYITGFGGKLADVEIVEVYSEDLGGWMER